MIEVNVSKSGILINNNHPNSTSNLSQFQINKVVNSLVSKYCFKHDSEQNREMMSIEINRCVKIIMILNKLK